jgi:hypothetical protein
MRLATLRLILLTRAALQQLLGLQPEGHPSEREAVAAALDQQARSLRECLACGAPAGGARSAGVCSSNTLTSASDLSAATAAALPLGWSVGGGGSALPASGALAPAVTTASEFLHRRARACARGGGPRPGGEAAALQQPRKGAHPARPDAAPSPPAA